MASGCTPFSALRALLAINLAAAKGDIADSGAIAWKLDTDTPYVPSPLLYENRLYLLKSNSGILSCLDAQTGERYFRERLPGIENVFASPVAAAGRVYVTSREGTTVVIGSGPEFKVLASNLLEDAFDASMAVVDREVYLRGRRHLYRIAED
jgi:outer membrane protein assembly factor BamB